MQPVAMKILSLWLIASTLLVCCITTSHEEDPQDLTHWAKSRQKRFLIFPNIGVHKFIISLALTIDLKDKRAWRSLSGAWNFQWQHNLPLTPLKWWNSTYLPAKARSMSQDIDIGDTPIDMTATFLYELLETYMTNKGMNGRECLQRAICENAQITHVGGVLDHIYKRFLTPERSMEDFYKDSYAMGLKGVDCYRTYFGCPKGKSLFDQFVHVNDVPD